MVQSLLASRGYDVGPVDGLMGPRTREAVIAFQRDSGVPQTGVIDAALMDLLMRGG
jgi:localization factor PodJL